MIELGILFILTLANAFLALSEMALASSAQTRLEILSKADNRGAKKALKLLEKPTQFLAMVQVGITLNSTIAGAYGASVFAEPLSIKLAGLGLPYSYAISTGLVIVFLTFLSVVLGEIVPKRVALQAPEKFASATAPALDLLIRIFFPFAKVLELGSSFLLTLIGIRTNRKNSVTEEEVRAVIRAGANDGALEQTEREIVDQVLRIGGKSVSSIMTPRQDCIVLTWNELTQEKIREIIKIDEYDNILIHAEGNEDVIEGIIPFEFLARDTALDRTPLRERLLKPVSSVSHSMEVNRALKIFKDSDTYGLLILDDFGGFDGVLTFSEIVSSVLGEFDPEDEGDEEWRVKKDKAIEADAAVDIDEAFEKLGLDPLPHDDRRGYHSLGGFFMSELGRLPKPGESIQYKGIKLKVLSMERQRILKILIKHLG